MTNQDTTFKELVARAAAVDAQLTAPGAPFELIEVEADGHRLKAYGKAQASLAEFIQLGRGHGDDPFLSYRGDDWSFNRFYAAVDALAGRLQADLGIKPGDRVAIAMRNRPEWCVAFAAIASVGAVPAPINSFGLREELVAALQQVDSKLVFLDAARRERIAADLPDLGMRDVLVDERPPAGGTSLDFRTLIAAAGPQRILPKVNPDDPALILFTSGASGRAKAVLSSQLAVCQALYNIEYIGYSTALVSQRAVAVVMQRGLRPTTLCAVPLFHVSGLHAQFLDALRSGKRLVFMHRWDSRKAIDLIEAEHVTQFSGAPAMVMQLLKEPDFARRCDTLVGLGFGGAGLPQSVIDDLHTRKPDSLSGIGFGMTESNGVGAAGSGELFFARPHSAGRLSPISQTRVTAPDGKALPQGEEGELWLRGVAVMTEYWRNPQATIQALDPDGWLRTGDIGFVDTDGFLQVVDRIKDVINRSGEKIAAAEVESCLLQHPQVAEAAVFALPDAKTGEAVAAVVVPVAGARLESAAVRQFVTERLASYKVPRDVFVSDEP
ncbi:MAG TPA: class I adenylate-forming enzyme family protein, partial [Nevskiaceae bacterium]|nr:class I adenylate-forming enzyme family protein [Nevskiaceae bacterium]